MFDPSSALPNEVGTVASSEELGGPVSIVPWSGPVPVAERS